jgi:hypothetical protein
LFTFCVANIDILFMNYLQSFADLWVDFLLKETEEREKREASEAARLSQEENQTASTSNASSAQPSGHISNQAPGPSTSHHMFGRQDTEFATVPLTSSTYTTTQTPFSRPPQR